MPLDAGPLDAWLVALGGSLVGEGEMDVPCDDCTACCTSAQFVLVEPADVAARAVIPAGLLFPAPGMPEGHLLMGFDEHGRCPMLLDGTCSIYESRPRTCRTYDCRVFAAAGVAPEDQPDIAARVRRWHFGEDHSSEEHGGEERSSAEHLGRIRDAVDPTVDRPLERALRAVGPVAVELAQRVRRPTEGNHRSRRGPTGAA